LVVPDGFALVAVRAACRAAWHAQGEGASGRERHPRVIGHAEAHDFACIIPKAPLVDSRGGFPNRGRADSSWRGEIRAMPSAVRLREDYSAEALRALARRSKDANQSRRLLSLAAVRDGMDRRSAAKLGGMDRQRL